MLTSARLTAAAAQVAAESPPLGDFPEHAVKPSKNCRRHVRAAGWPAEIVTVGHRHAEWTDAAGSTRPAGVQQVAIAIVPEAWLLRLIELTSATFDFLCDGRYSAAPLA